MLYFGSKLWRSPPKKSYATGNLRALPRVFELGRRLRPRPKPKTIRLMSKTRAGQRANRPMSGKGPILFLIYPLSTPRSSVERGIRKRWREWGGGEAPRPIPSNPCPPPAIGPSQRHAF